MRVIPLKSLVIATFYRAPAGSDPKTPLVPVPPDAAFDPDTMQEQRFDYRANLEAILKSPSDPQRGMQIEDVRRSVKILDALDRAKGTKFILEDEEYSHLKARVDAAFWPFALPAVVSFVDDIDHAQAVSKERLEAAIGDDPDVPHPAEPGHHNGKAKRPLSVK